MLMTFQLSKGVLRITLGDLMMLTLLGYAVWLFVKLAQSVAGGRCRIYAALLEVGIL
jgi:hypothetical protein